MQISAAPSVAPSAVTTPAAAAPPVDGKLTVAQFNVENLFPPGDTSGGKDLNPTPEQYQTKLTKLALAITDKLGSPDVIAVEEVGNERCLPDLLKMTNLGKEGYKALYLPTNDKRHINVGLLYRESAELHFDGARELNPLADKGLPPAGGQIDLDQLFARPPLVADFTVTGVSQAAAGAAAVQPRKVEIVVNHFMSKLGNSGGPRRKAQGAFVGGFVDAQRAADPNRSVIVTGDLNSYTGEPGYKQIANYRNGKPRMYDAPEVGVKKEDRYTYVYKGQPGMLDHMLVTPELKDSIDTVSIPHFNTSAWDEKTHTRHHQDDASIADGVSDHDPMVASFDIDKLTSTSAQKIAS